jgi:short-subunit dehydrogenase
MFGAYNSTKYAVESLSDALRMELAPFGVHVSLLEPGVIRTNFTERSVAATIKYRDQESPYSGAFGRMDKTVELSDKMAVGPEATTKAILRAVRTRRPRARYMTPLSGRLTVAFLRLLPTRWGDAILRSTAGLTRKNLRPVIMPRAARPVVSKRAA